MDVDLSSKVIDKSNLHYHGLVQVRDALKKHIRELEEQAAAAAVENGHEAEVRVQMLIEQYCIPLHCHESAIHSSLFDHATVCIIMRALTDAYHRLEQQMSVWHASGNRCTLHMHGCAPLLLSCGHTRQI